MDMQTERAAAVARGEEIREILAACAPVEGQVFDCLPRETKQLIRLAWRRACGQWDEEGCRERFPIRGGIVCLDGFRLTPRKPDVAPAAGGAGGATKSTYEAGFEAGFEAAKAAMLECLSSRHPR